jgi:hypothetical protein
MAEETLLELALDAAEELLEQYRGYLRDKNEIIKAYAGPTGMTPEDVAYALEERERLQEAARRLVELLEAEGNMFDTWFYREFVALADAAGVKVYRSTALEEKP